MVKKRAPDRANDTRSAPFLNIHSFAISLYMVQIVANFKCVTVRYSCYLFQLGNVMEKWENLFGNVSPQVFAGFYNFTSFCFLFSWKKKTAAQQPYQSTTL